jgi:O-antigen/teichoic acid export membrane protein
MRSNQRKIGAVLSYATIIANTLIQLLYTPFLIRKLGQSEYGLFSLVSSIIGYLTVLDLGFGNAIIVHSTKYRTQGEEKKEIKLYGMFRIIYMIIGVIVGIVGLVLLLNTNNIFGSSLKIEELQKMRIMMLILSFNLFATFSFSLYSSIITSHEQFIFQKIIALINAIAKPCIMIPLLFLGFKSIALCVAITVVNIAVLLSNYIFCRKKLKIKVKFYGFDKKIFRTILTYSFWIFINQIVDKINWSADQFILGAISGTVAVSVYSAASTLNTLFINLSTAISGVMLPKVSKMVAQKASSEKLTEEFIKVGRIQYYIIFLMASGLVIFGKQFIRLWLGDDFEETYAIALILIIPLCFPLIQNLGLSILQAMNKYKFKAVSTFIMSILNIFMSIALVRKYGATGAAVGTAIALVVCNILIINVYYKKIIGLNVVKFWAQIMKMTALFMIPAATCAVVVNNLVLDSWRKIGIAIAAYSICYGMFAFVFCLNNYEKGIIKTFILMLNKATEGRKK